MTQCRASRALLFSVMGAFTLLLMPACQLRRPVSVGPFDYPTAPSPAAKSSAPALPATVQVGDTLEVMVIEDPSFNTKAVVRESGDLILPKIGRVRVLGLSLSGAEAAVQKLVQDEQIKDAKVIVERTQRLAQAGFSERPKLLIFLTGAIARPGQHLIALSDRDGVTAYEALLIGGGANAYGDKRRAYILRKAGPGMRQRVPVDLQLISQGQGIDPLLQQGDVLYVPERRFGF
jgi:protein involved in polysaccharide export with SLBB domain